MSSHVHIQKLEILNSFFKSHTRIQYKKGETVLRPEDQTDDVFLVEWGFVKSYIMTKYGEENLLVVRGTGSVFPIIRVFTGEGRNVTYEAMEPTSLWRVRRIDYVEFLDKNPDVLPIILDMAIDSYRLHSERVITLTYRTARERVVSFLLTLAKRFGVPQKDGTTIINAPFRQSDIASSINATRETTSREINGLRKKNLIDVIDHKIIIKDKKAMRELL